MPSDLEPTSENPKNLPQPITDIPQDSVGEVVQRSLDYDAVTLMEVKRQPNGKFTVTPKAVNN